MASPDKKAFALRIDPALWAQIERLAAQDLRSANSQVEVLLREALARRGITPARAGPAPDAPGTPDSPSAPSRPSDP